MEEKSRRNVEDLDNKELMELVRDIRLDLIAGGYITKDGKAIGVLPIGEDSD